MFVIKFAFKEDIRRVTVDKVLSLVEVEELAKSLFKESLPESFILRYKDDEGDLITVTSNREIEEAFRLFKESILRIIIEPAIRSIPLRQPNIPRNSTSEKTSEDILDVFNLSPFLEALGGQLREVCPKIEEQVQELLPKIEEHVSEILPKIEETLSQVFGGNIRSEEEEKEEESGPRIVHPAICDNCKKRIIGIRWKCTTCPDYDLCGSCKKLGNIHTEHQFNQFDFSVRRGGPCACPIFQNQQQQQQQNQQSEESKPFQIPIIKEETKEENVMKPLTPLRIIPKTEEVKVDEEVKKESSPCVMRPLTPLRIIPKTEEPKKEEVKVELPKEPVVVVEEKKEVSPFESKLKQLEEMGFFDRQRNIELLVQHKGDMITVVRYLLE